MRSTFWPNRIFERESFQNRHAGLEFSPKGENSGPSMQIVQNALFRSCAAKSKFSKSWNWPEIFFKAEKECGLQENCTKPAFQVMRTTFWPNRILERQSSQNRHAGLKFSRKRENNAPSMKIVQDALFRSCAGRFRQIAFLSVKVLKIVTLAWNSLEIGKTVRFSWKLYKTLFSGHAHHVLAKSHFWASNFQIFKFQIVKTKSFHSQNTQFWAAFAKIKPFGTKQTVLSSLFQTKPFLANTHRFDQLFLKSSYFGQNHPSEQHLPK